MPGFLNQHPISLSVKGTVGLDISRSDRKVLTVWYCDNRLISEIEAILLEFPESLGLNCETSVSERNSPSSVGLKQSYWLDTSRRSIPWRVADSTRAAGAYPGASQTACSCRDAAWYLTAIPGASAVQLKVQNASNKNGKSAMWSYG